MSGIHKLKNLFINRVASVDKGAGEGVEILLMKNADEGAVEAYLKRNFSEKQRRDLANSGKAMSDGSFPIENEGDLHNAIRAVGRSKDPKAAKAHIIARAKAMGDEGALPDGWNVAKAEILPEIETASADLLKSVESILGDSSETAKAEMLAKSFEQFNEHLNGEVVALIAKKDKTMAKDPKDMNDNDADDKAKAFADKLKKAESDLESANKALAVAKRELAFATMTETHKEYVAKADMSEGERDAFVNKSASDRDAEITAQPLEKRMPVHLRKAQEELVTLRKQVADMAEVGTVLSFEKRASDLGFKGEFGAVLRKAYAGDAEAITKFETEIKALRKQASTGSLFATFGKSQSEGGSAMDALMGKADELRKTETKLTREQAFAKVYEDPANHELVKQYKGEKQAAI